MIGIFSIPDSRRREDLTCFPVSLVSPPDFYQTEQDGPAYPALLEGRDLSLSKPDKGTGSVLLSWGEQKGKTTAFLVTDS